MELRVDGGSLRVVILVVDGEDLLVVAVLRVNEGSSRVVDLCVGRVGLRDVTLRVDLKNLRVAVRRVEELLRVVVLRVD